MRRYSFIVALLVLIVLSASGPTYSQDAGADITITDTIIAPDPPRFGANIFSHNGSNMNMWLADCTEPVVMRLMGVADGGGADYILHEEEPQTDVWDTIYDGMFDGGDARVYRIVDEAAQLVRRDTISRFLASDVHRIELASDGPPVLPGDRYIISITHPDKPLDHVHPRMEHLFEPYADCWRPHDWEWDGSPAVAVSRDSSSAVVGQNSLRIESLQSDPDFEQGVIQYNIWPTGIGGDNLLPGTEYVFDAWLRQEGVAGGHVRVSFSEFHEIEHTFTVSDEWQHYRFAFSGPQPLRDPEGAVNGVQVMFGGSGTVWMDNPRIYRADVEPYAALPEMIAAAREFNPDVIRFWGGQPNEGWGTTLDSWLAAPGEQLRWWETNAGVVTPLYFNLPLALDFVQQVGGKPWMQVSVAFDESEWLNLIEYLAGPAESPYGAIRAEHGQGAPWTDEFEDIYIELGNETWNDLFMPMTAFGWEEQWGRSYGAYAHHIFSVAQSSPYYAAVADKLHFVLGGFVLSADLNGYGANAVTRAPQAEAVGITNYLGGWEFADATGADLTTRYQNLLLFSPQGIEPFVDAHVATQQALAGQGVDYDLVVYEAGPGYALPSPEEPLNMESEYVGKSLVGATATLDAMLYSMQAGARALAFYAFEPGANWTSHTLHVNGYRPHAPWLALQMRNQHCSGDMVQTVFDSGPTIDLPAQDEGFIPPRADVPLVTSYAFRDDDSYCIFVLSRDVTQTIPVTLHLPGEPAPAATLYTLTGDPTDTNIDAMNITVEEQTISDMAATYTFDLRPASIYLYKTQVVD